MITYQAYCHSVRYTENNNGFLEAMFDFKDKTCKLLPVYCLMIRQIRFVLICILKHMFYEDLHCLKKKTLRAH